MAQQLPAAEQTQFGGVVTSGHPLSRPTASAARCKNFRVMPGNWLRLRSGRVQRSISYNRINRLHEVRLANGTNYVAHFWQADLANGQSWWQQVLVNISGSYVAYAFEQLGTSSFTANSFPAACNARNRVMLANGQGVRDGATSSKPPLTQTFGDGAIRYVGLDAYHPTGSPTVAAVDGVGGTSHILYKRDVYVGIHNTVTGHFSNGVYAGTVTSSDPGTVTRATTLTVENIDKLVRTAHGSTSITDGSGTQFMFANEAAELVYVFYVTADGGSVPYLLIDANGDVVTTTAASYQIDMDDLVLSTTQEMPRYNFPPRPMGGICYANGRVYGFPTSGGSSLGDKDFDYAWSDKDMAKVCWSATADDSDTRDFVGIPEESWPLNNNKYTPNGQRPKHVAATADGTRVLVITQTGTFLLEETADGLHQWDTVSLTSGIWDARSFAVTAYGLVWLDQHRQIVMLPHGGAQLQVLSTDYADLLKAATATTPAAYVLDPPNQVDRYQIWLGDGTSVCHDFVIGGAYTTDNQSVTAAATLLDSQLKAHHIICINGYAYTQEGQPDTNSAVPVADEVPVSPMLGSHTWTEITGDYIGQWLNFGEARLRKEFSDWVVQGDGESAISLSWYADLDSTEMPVALKKLPQSDTDMAYQGKLSKGMRRWIKQRLQLAGHSADATVTTYPSYTTGDPTPSEYGAIWNSQLTVDASGNR